MMCKKCKTERKHVGNLYMQKGKHMRKYEQWECPKCGDVQRKACGPVKGSFTENGITFSREVHDYTKEMIDILRSPEPAYPKDEVI